MELWWSDIDKETWGNRKKTCPYPTVTVINLRRPGLEWNQADW